MVFSSIRKLYSERKYQSALEELNAFDLSNLPRSDKLEYYDIKCKMLNKLSKYEEILEFIDNPIVECTDIYDPSIFKFYIYKLSALNNLSKYTTIEEIVKLLKSKYKEKLFGDDPTLKKYTAEILLQEANALIYQNKYQECNIQLKKSVDIAEKYELPKIKALSYKNLGNLNYYQNRIDDAISYYTKSIRIFESLENKKNVADLQNNLAVIYSDQGDIRPALNLLHSALKIHKNRGVERDIGDVYNNLGVLYKELGEISKSLKYYKQSLEIRERVGNLQGVAGTKANLGQIYMMLDENEIALGYFKDALSIDQQIGNTIFLAEDYYNLVTTNLRLENTENVNRYLASLKSLQDKSDNELVEQYFRITQAIIFKNKQRRKYKTKAQNLLEELINQENIAHELKIKSMIHLSDLLLDELEKYENETIIEEINSYVTELIENAKFNHSFLLLIELYILQSKLAVINYKFDKAMNFLNQAQLIAIENGIKFSEKLIQNEIKNLEQMREEWTDEPNNLSLKMRVKGSQIDRTMDNIITTRIRNIGEDIPVFVIILNRDGLCLMSKSFDDIERSDQLVANFISAINSFMSNIFKEDGVIESISFKQYDVVLKAIQPILFCYIFKGNSNKAVHKLDNLIEKIIQSNTIWNDLVRTIPRVERKMEQRLDQFISETIG